jgi:hypothetical protein
LPRRVLFSHRGRVGLSVVWFAAGTITLVVYWIARSPVYGLVQFAIITAAFFWVRWALRRPRSSAPGR